MVKPHHAAQRPSRALAAAVTALAARQHGVITFAQLLALGASRHEIAAMKWLRPVHRGVYKVGAGPMNQDARWLAAVLAVGDDAVLYGRSACAALGFASDDRRVVHVASRRELKRRAGIRPHHVVLEAAETGDIRGIPVSEPNRAIADFAAGATRRELEQAMDAAAYERVLDLSKLSTYADQRRRGSRALREVLLSHTPGTTITRSEMEEKFLHLVDRFGLPRPQEMNRRHELPNGRIIRIDAVYADLAVELDGRGAHAHAKAFRTDRERDRQLTLQGFRPVRFTYDDITAHARRTANELRSLIEPVVVPRGAA